MKTTTPFATTTLALIATLACSAATAASLYGTVYSAPTPIYSVNLGTGGLTAGPATGIGDVTDLASSGLDNTVWGVSSGNNTLYRFNVETGGVLATVPIVGSVGPTGGPQTVISIAYDNRNGTLYGNSAAAFGGNNDLFKIDPASGNASLVGNLQIDRMYALAFNDADGFLYGISGEIGQDSLFWRIDPTTAAAFSIAVLQPTGNFDIAFDPLNNTLYMASSGTSSLYKLGLNGATALIGPYGSGANIAGLAFAVPEPQTYALMFSGLAAVGWVARRRVRRST